MKRSILFFALVAMSAGAQAADGLKLGVGVDYSSGDYDSDTTTTILSVPFTARYTRGDWSFKASLPWVRVDGDPNVLPGLGGVDNGNPNGRGRGRGNGGGGTTAPAESGAASGIGDLRLAAIYSVDTGSDLGLDLTGNFKLATADEDKGLGTGANDYGVAVDLYRQVGSALLFGGVGYTWLGDSDYIDVDAVANANLGVSWRAGGGNLGLIYDYRQAASDGYDPRSEVTAFYALNAGESTRIQLYGVAGLSDGSPDWGGGVSLTRGF
ncbi:transporter [Marilutibacter maris]|uniref:Transporter n=1 Tax=Marilutibacter maris TaxID=1605891 RepID=A0A2U9TB30_9GAMM|nr:transporter [Lysobacter maris]AWV08565.1 hypothetical protein C9I47_2895 [Lysobacter maris]